jgi:hypothetical protein
MCDGLRYRRGDVVEGCNGEVVGLVTLIQRPLRPTLQTQVGHLPTSEKCRQKATFVLQQIFLFDDPVGDGKQFTRHRETERSSSLEVDE